MGSQSGGVVREADEPERPVHVRLHAAVDAVDVFGAVERAPFQAYHVDRSAFYAFVE